MGAQLEKARAAATAKAAGLPVDPAAVPPSPQAPAPTSGLPWDLVQDEMGVEARVIISGVTGVLGVYVQEEIRRQVRDVVPGVAGVLRGSAQDEIAPGG